LVAGGAVAIVVAVVVSQPSRLSAPSRFSFPPGSPAKRALIESIRPSGLKAGARTPHGPPVPTYALQSRRVVPWISTLAQSPPVPRLAPSCRADELTAQLELQGATQNLVGGIELTNRGSEPCSLLGRVHLGLIGGSDPYGVDFLTDPTSSPVQPGVPLPSLRALARGQSAFVGLVWSNWCGQRTPSGLELRFPSGDEITVTLERGEGAPFCAAPHHRSQLTVARAAQPQQAQPSNATQLPLTAAIVEHQFYEGELRPGVYGRPGDTVDYEIALTNSSTQPFRFGASCPTYLEATGFRRVSPMSPASFLPLHTELHVLNCHPVPTIRPGLTVLFAMHILFPRGVKHGINPLTWTLAPATNSPPFAGGVIIATGR